MGTAVLAVSKFLRHGPAATQWTVNGKSVPAYCGADAVDGDTIVAGRWVLFSYDGTQLNFSGGGGLSLGKLAQATAKPGQVLAGVPYYAGNKTLKKEPCLTAGKTSTAGAWKPEPIYSNP